MSADGTAAPTTERSQSDVYTRAMRAAGLARFCYERVGNLWHGIHAIHRGDFESARWYLSLGGFCPDQDSSKVEAVDEGTLDEDVASYAYPTMNGQGFFVWKETA